MNKNRYANFNYSFYMIVRMHNNNKKTAKLQAARKLAHKKQVHPLISFSTVTAGFRAVSPSDTFCRWNGKWRNKTWFVLDGTAGVKVQRPRDVTIMSV